MLKRESGGTVIPIDRGSKPKDDSNFDGLRPMLAELLAGLHEVVAEMKRPTPQKRCLSRTEAAELLNVSESTVKNFEKAGVLVEGDHYVKEGNNITYHPDIVDLFFKSCRDRTNRTKAHSGRKTSEHAGKKRQLRRTPATQCAMNQEI